MALPKTTQEPIIHVEATPNEGYPLRILEAYRENCNCRFVSNYKSPLIDQMNADYDKRGVILDKAIACLKKFTPYVDRSVDGR